MRISLDWARPRLDQDTWLGVGAACAALALLTALAAPFAGERDAGAVAAVMLLVVVLVAARWGYVPGIAGAVLADLLLNFFFVPPLHTLSVREPRDIVILASFLGAALVAASLLARLKLQLARVRARESELRALLDLSRALAAASTPVRAVDVLAESARRALRARSCAVLEYVDGRWETVVPKRGPAVLSREEAAVADHARTAGDVASLTEPALGRRQSFAVRSGTVASTFVPFRTGDGRTGVLHLAGPLTPPPGGDASALLRAFADEAGTALQRVRLAEEARLAEVYQRADEFKSVVLSSVSHDLRSPLTAIKAAVGSLRQPGISWDADDREAFLETIESQCDRLTATVSGLLEMSRLEGGAAHAHLEPVDLGLLLADAVVTTRPATAPRAVTIEAAGPIWAKADYSFLMQALTNLIENAARYSKAGGKIRLRASPDSAAGRVHLEVADAGPGIAAADLPHIFERFYRGSAAKGASPGTGLGLAIVRALVELCGGKVSVESSPAGTTFRITLDASRPPS